MTDNAHRAGAGEATHKAGAAGHSILGQISINMPVRRGGDWPGLDDLRAALAHIEGGAQLLDCDGALDFLASVCARAPFLGQLAGGDPARLVDIFCSDPLARMERLCGQLRALTAGSEAELMRRLRLARQESALTIALADLAGLFDLAAVTENLSRFADAALGAAIRFCLENLTHAGKFCPAFPGDPAEKSGYIVLALGKYGARELNYSSDIDLIILYDPDTAPFAQEGAAAQHFVRMTRQIIRILSERTAQGYVFRVDLRLRPDADVTPAAISVPAALAYYESLGQGWERAALLKARACAGDMAAGEAFLAELRPFVWRKYLDYTAIEEIRALTGKIHASKGHDRVAVAGHNIKLGRGGIREIEFFVQSRQLIFGGRHLALRARATLAALDLLTHHKWVSPKARAGLCEAYHFLRDVEHRLQMVNDEQTHTLPAAPGPRDAIAALAGFPDLAAFDSAVRRHLRCVERHYRTSLGGDAAGLEDAGVAPAQKEADRPIVSPGTDEDLEAEAKLSALGFAEPGMATEIVRGWLSGRYLGLRSSRARAMLTALQSELLHAIGTTDDPDRVLRSFDLFFKKLPAGLQFFALLRSNPRLFDLIVSIMSAAPRLAGLITRRVHVLDNVIEAHHGDNAPARPGSKRLEAAGSYEAGLDAARIYADEQQFLIGISLLSDAPDALRAARRFSDLADMMIGHFAQAALELLCAAHGRIEGCQYAIVALGRLGDREMTASSDLDLIVLYDHPESITSSDGKRPLAPSHYFIRFTQRLITALTTQTAQGHLYDVDFRLRPSGNAGPLATHIDSFIRYQNKDAWTWEHMALTRARVVTASCPGFARRVQESITRVLEQPRNGDALRRDVRDMRARLAREKPASGPWDLKRIDGGMTDLEFAAQYLQLLHGRMLLASGPAGKGVPPATPASAPDKARLETLFAASRAAGLLPPDESRTLQEAAALFRTITQFAASALGTLDDISERAPPLFQKHLAQMCDCDDFAGLQKRFEHTKKNVHATFAALIS